MLLQQKLNILRHDASVILTKYENDLTFWGFSLEKSSVALFRPSKNAITDKRW